MGLYQENYLDIGLGMKPDLTGQGKGPSFFQTGLAFAKTNFQSKKIRLTVEHLQKSDNGVSKSRL